MQGSASVSGEMVFLGCIYGFGRSQHPRPLERAGVDRHGKRAPVAEFAGDVNIAAQGLCQSSGYGQPKPRAAVTAARRGIQLRERPIEESSILSAEMPMPVSETANCACAEPSVSEGTQRDADPAAIGELDGVANQVGKDLTQRTGSAWMVSGSGKVKSTSRLRPFSSARTCTTDRTLSMTRRKRQSTFSNVSLSASMSDRSRMSLINSSNALPFL